MKANSRAVEFDPDRGQTVPGLGPDAYSTELAAMEDRAFCFSDRYRDQQGRATRYGAQPEILDFERKLVKRAFKIGIPLFAHSVIRTWAEQSDLLKKGVTKAKPGDSPHNYGAAVDVIHGTKGWNLTQRQWAILGHMGKELAIQAGIKIVWGGDWKFYDPAHWELRDWREIRAKYVIDEDEIYPWEPD